MSEHGLPVHDQSTLGKYLPEVHRAKTWQNFQPFHMLCMVQSFSSSNFALAKHFNCIKISKKHSNVIWEHMNMCSAMATFVRPVISSTAHSAVAKMASISGVNEHPCKSSIAKLKACKGVPG